VTAADDRIPPLQWPGDTADGLYIVDHQQRIVRWNRGAERLLGYAAREVLGRPCYDVLDGCGHNHQQVCGRACAVDRAVRRGELPPGRELHVRRKDGVRIWIRMSILVVPHGSEPLRLHLLQDVSESREAVDAMAQISRLCRSRTSLPTAVSHKDDRASSTGRVRLTARERMVLRLLADGLSNKAVASRLGVSTHTVRNHVQHILEKSGTHSRAEAIALTLRRGIL
jgi:PAS domain S-box-containing protein